MSINIAEIIKERFRIPLADNYKRRIIFWQDPDGEFSNLVDELCIDGVKIFKLNGNNNFAAKQLLSETDTTSNYLVYNPCIYSDIRDNWLLDLELYSEEFRADLLSILMQDLGMPSSHQMRKAMKAYSKFFDNKERMAKLKAFQSHYQNPGQLHIDILAVLSGASSNTASGVIRAILMNGLDIESNAAITNIKKFGDESILWDLINRYVGYTHSIEQTSLIALASHILLTTLTVTMKPACLSGLEKYISVPHQQHCYDLVNEWIRGSTRLPEA